MRLAVNIDHFATLRQARRSTEPEPVLAALLSEMAGAHGIVCHLRGDRRHITERDLEALRATVKTKLNLEMAATEPMMEVALRVRPDVVSLVPESPDELTTEGGLNVLAAGDALGPVIERLRGAGIRVSIFIDPDLDQIGGAAKAGVDLIEINTARYSEAAPGRERDDCLAVVRKAAEYASRLGLEVHAGHGLDYRNAGPIAAVPQFSEFSIGFAIVARSAIVGIERAVREMREILER